MKLLVVAATEMEIAAFRSAAGTRADILITGVGMTATTYALTKHLQSNKYDLIIQTGVGGSFDRNIPLGEVVFITSDTYGDIGAEDHDEYIDIFGLGLLGADDKPFSAKALKTPLQAIHNKISLRQESGITVNTVSGSEQTITRRQKSNCAIESMEGAAFHYVCLMENAVFAQVRGISNYVTPRDKSQWKMKDAIINLNNWLIDFTAGL